MRTIDVSEKNVIFQRTIKSDDKLRLYKYLIQIHCMLKNIYLPESETSLLSYYAAYGINRKTETKFKEDTQRNSQILANLRYKLWDKYKLIIKHEGFNSWELPQFLKYNLENGVTFVLNFQV